MSKRIAAVAMSSRIGETFDAIVTGLTSQEQCLRTAKQRNCPFLNSFIPDAIGTVRVTPVTHIGTVNTKTIPIPTLNPGEKNFDGRIELLNQDLAREYHEA